MKKFTYMLYISLSIILSFLIYFVASKKLEQFTSAQSYTDINIKKTNNHKIKIIDINKLINDEIEGLIYFGRDTCPVCQKLNEEFLDKEIYENNNLIIYEFNTNYWRNDENFEKILDKYNISTIPTIVKINSDKSYTSFKATLDNDFKNEDFQLKFKTFLYN